MWLIKLRKTTRSSKSQILPTAALLMIVLVCAVGLAVDTGRLFVARAKLIRAVDAAALAGSLELPDTSNMQSQAQAQVDAYMQQNQPGATYTMTASQADKQIQLSASLPVSTIFMRILGINSITVSANATAGFGVLAVDTVMIIDATGSMGVDSQGHSCSGSGCPIYDAKSAATAFTNTLLSGSLASSDTLVGETPFRGCFNLPNLFSMCVPINTMVQPLSSSKTTVDATINSITSVGGSGTNICNGINEADQILYGTNHHTVSNTMRIVVLLSDGDNTYNVVANGVPTPSGFGRTPTPIAGYALPSACKPPTPNASTDDTSTSCMPAQTHQKALDNDTMTLVNQMKAQGVEFYVVGLGVCGTTDTTTPCNTSMIGGNYDDTVANRNLLKCIASSKSNNDHYFEAQNSTQLTSIFQNIARLIGFRLIK